MLTQADLEKRFGTTGTHPGNTAWKHDVITNGFLQLATVLLIELEDGRERDMALDRLQEASMWAHKAAAEQMRPKAFVQQPVLDIPNLGKTHRGHVCTRECIHDFPEA